MAALDNQNNGSHTMAASRQPDGDALPSPAAAGQGPPFTGYRRADWGKATQMRGANFSLLQIEEEEKNHTTC